MQSDADAGDAHVQHTGSNSLDVHAYDASFGGPEERKRLEKKLLRKVDARMSILIVIYVLNYVSLSHQRGRAIRRQQGQFSG
jgi:hypothetical protein